MARALIADIGGTNTRVALAEGGRIVAGSVRHYRNAAFAGPEPVLHRFLADAGEDRVAAACLAMAGPVRAGKGHLTNLDWTLDTRLLAGATGADTVALLNDLQAQGHALGHIPAGALEPVVPGAPPDGPATRLVIGIGTGFNAAPVYDTAGGREVPPAEAGHTTLPGRTDADLRLIRYIESRDGVAAVEDALSGRGICAIHDWLADEAGAPGGASSREIMEALEAGESRARAAAAVFARLTGRVAGDLALSLLPFGGVFLIGGMARAMAPWLVDLGFVEAFRDKGRFSGFMEQFAVTVVSDDDAALTGCALHLDALTRRG